MKCSTRGRERLKLITGTKKLKKSLCSQTMRTCRISIYHLAQEKCFSSGTGRADHAVESNRIGRLHIKHSKRPKEIMAVSRKTMDTKPLKLMCTRLHIQLRSRTKIVNCHHKFIAELRHTTESEWTMLM